MTKRSKIEIIKDILDIVNKNNNSIKITPLIRKSNLSTTRFNKYYGELITKGLLIEKIHSGRIISTTQKGLKYLEKYSTIVGFIEEFDL